MLWGDSKDRAKGVQMIKRKMGGNEQHIARSSLA